MSPSTVLRALSDSDQVSKTTRKKVQQLAIKINDTHNIWAENWPNDPFHHLLAPELVVRKSI
jgi:hypothetical protein